MKVFNNVILARKRQLPDDDDRLIETCRSIFKSFNVNNLSVCIGWCADQVTLRIARCYDKDYKTDFSLNIYKYMQSNFSVEYHVKIHLPADMLKNLCWLCTLPCKWRED